MYRHFALLPIAVIAASCLEPEPEPPSQQSQHHHEHCRIPAVTADAARPAPLMAADRLDDIAGRLPCVADEELTALLESSDTMFYDATGIAPGYQDSFGDDVVLPLGMRPNSIDPVHIDLAVPGGHQQIFEQVGQFHFPFGRPTGVPTDRMVAVDFWHVPRDDEGDLLPVVHWTRSPSGYTRRVEWVFPVGTVFGELLFLVGGGGHWFPFEIRTRTREQEGWTADVLRPFPRAEDLAARLRSLVETGEMDLTTELEALIAHLEDPSTLEPATLGASHFAGAFATVQGAEDVLPSLSDPSPLHDLLRETGFRSARNLAWKRQGTLTAYAPTTRGPASIVPPGYNGGLVAVDDDSCTRCHRDAGRPFRDYYPNIIAYGELWGQDEVFTWHPFETSRFLGDDGDVVNFNHDNRAMRQDFVQAGLIAPFSAADHPDSVYTRIPRDWHGYVY